MMPNHRKSTTKSRSIRTDESIILTEKPLDHDMAMQGFEFIESALGLGSSLDTKHPLNSIFWAAKEAMQSSPITWGPSREFNMLASWGMQLSMVAHWRGFDELLNRIKTEMKTYDAHLTEALVAARFWVAGCEGAFFDPKSEPAPDLLITTDHDSFVVECKQSRSLTAKEAQNRAIWQPASAELMRFLRSSIPAGMARFCPTRDAQIEDSDHLLAGIRMLVKDWKSYCATRPDQKWAANKTRSPDGAFSGIVVFAHEPDLLFDPAALQAPGIDIPDETEATSLALTLTLGTTPTCDGFWYVKIHAKRDWVLVEKAVLKRIDRKASQLNRFFQGKSKAVKELGVVWIDHPALNEATQADMKHLCDRIKGKLDNDTTGHFASVDNIILCCSRLLLNKRGQVVPQHRLNVIENEAISSKETSHCPYVSSDWWVNALSGDIPKRHVFGKRMGFAKLSDVL